MKHNDRTHWDDRKEYVRAAKERWKTGATDTIETLKPYNKLDRLVFLISCIDKKRFQDQCEDIGIIPSELLLDFVYDEMNTFKLFMKNHGADIKPESREERTILRKSYNEYRIKNKLKPI
jgi:hypothetical protein